MVASRPVVMGVLRIKIGRLRILVARLLNTANDTRLKFDTRLKLLGAALNLAKCTGLKLLGAALNLADHTGLL